MREQSPSTRWVLPNHILLLFLVKLKYKSILLYPLPQYTGILITLNEHSQLPNCPHLYVVCWCCLCAASLSIIGNNYRPRKLVELSYIQLHRTVACWQLHINRSKVPSVPLNLVSCPYMLTTKPRKRNKRSYSRLIQSIFPFNIENKGPEC